jgi:hypothetical protein
VLSAFKDISRKVTLIACFACCAPLQHSRVVALQELNASFPIQSGMGRFNPKPTQLALSADSESANRKSMEKYCKRCCAPSGGQELHKLQLLIATSCLIAGLIQDCGVVSRAFCVVTQSSAQCFPCSRAMISRVCCLTTRGFRCALGVSRVSMK